MQTAREMIKNDAIESEEVFTPLLQFLDSQHIDKLTMYLQALHKQGLATEDHTTLLLNCYTKLNNTEKLKEFIMVSKVIWNYRHVTWGRGPQISKNFPNFGHQEGDTKQVLCRGLSVLERPVNFIFIYCFLLGIWELAQFLYIRKKTAVIMLKIIDTATQYLVTWATRYQGFVHPWHIVVWNNAVTLNLLPYKLNYMWHNAHYLYNKGVFITCVSFMLVTCVFL